MIGGVLRAFAVCSAISAGIRIEKATRLQLEATKTLQQAEQQRVERLRGSTVSRGPGVSDAAFATALGDMAKPKPLDLRKAIPVEARVLWAAGLVSVITAGLLNRGATVLGRR